MLKRLIITFIGIGLLFAGVFTFLNQRDAQAIASNSDKLQVVTTNSILEDMVQQVGGKNVDVYSIVKRGVDPHEYDPQPTDIAKTTHADVIFHNGLNLETGGNGWFKKLIETANKTNGKEVFAASETVKPLYLTTNKNEKDPHAWLDLTNGIKYVQTMTKVLQQKDPKHQAAYAKNSAAYIAKLQKLHDTAKSKFLDIPENQRLLVTSEGAFKYFSSAYQITPAYIWEINTEAQGTPEQMKAVLATVHQYEPAHLFVEASVSPKSMNQVAAETGLKIYSKVFTDSLAKKGQAGDTYYDMMQWNLTHIHDGLATGA
ncbi:metal ABC transporter solute-binding protein, Zn/Mn family [Agrilactobacillus yilanensis]|uniref:Metal ABC transporter solute-binding protein, Zn/Mn family n=1 Tax=Agrilactobacillus yilanensis TaxID=2485997 RepID=A0ABW4J6N0_9LACO|nr:zinc ABC transporter substrate-binding protein [Agrilactobacillus yilanensis]